MANFFCTFDVPTGRQQGDYSKIKNYDQTSKARQKGLASKNKTERIRYSMDNAAGTGQQKQGYTNKATRTRQP
jgi:hypothetical protein